MCGIILEVYCHNNVDSDDEATNNLFYLIILNYIIQNHRYLILLNKFNGLTDQLHDIQHVLPIPMF